MSDRLMSAEEIEQMTGEIEALRENQIPDGHIAIPENMFIDLMNGKYQPYRLAEHFRKMTQGKKS